ncbi:MAG: HNH endonuclease [Deltaproteobacteria bacterium]|nr:HNH endonuclease [Deltaproteobacteria bacterium]
MIASDVLVLNSAYFPVHVTTLQRAMCMLYQGIVRAVDRSYRTFSFEHWRSLDPDSHHESLGLVGCFIRIPRVVLLVAYDRIPRRGIRFSRRNILLRDKYQCQYCCRHLSSEHLNLDHVVPRSQGGRTTWENVVTSCHHCNRRKGGFTPDEAGMRLLRKPYRPTSLPFFDLGARRYRYTEWQPFLTVVDASRWHVERE